MTMITMMADDTCSIIKTISTIKTISITISIIAMIIIETCSMQAFAAQ